MTQRPHALALDDTRRYLASLQPRLPLFVVCDHPTDFPDHYTARLHLTLPVPEVLPFVILNADLEQLRTDLEALGLVKITRDPADDPAILESWL